MRSRQHSELLQLSYEKQHDPRKGSPGFALGYFQREQDLRAAHFQESTRFLPSSLLQYGLSALVNSSGNDEGLNALMGGMTTTTTELLVTTPPKKSPF